MGVVVSVTSLAAANHVSALVRMFESPIGTSIGSELTDVLPEGAATTVVANGNETKILQVNYRLATAHRYVTVGLLSRHAADAAPGTAIDLPSGDSAHITAFMVFTGSDQDPTNLATADLGTKTGNAALDALGA